jgi:hypothetical protein
MLSKVTLSRLVKNLESRPKVVIFGAMLTMAVGMVVTILTLLSRAT